MMNKSKHIIHSDKKRNDTMILIDSIIQHLTFRHQLRFDMFEYVFLIVEEYSFHE